MNWLDKNNQIESNHSKIEKPIDFIRLIKNSTSKGGY